MINFYAKFEVSIFARYGNTNGNAKQSTAEIVVARKVMGRPSSSAT